MAQESTKATLTDLLGRDTLNDVARRCNIGVDNVEEIYPCTPLQVGIAAEPIERIYVCCIYATLAPQVDPDRYLDALRRVVSLNPVLRTRIIDTDAGIVQVVVKETPRVERSSHSLEVALGGAKSVSMPPGSPLFKVSLVENRKLVVAIHHVISDHASWRYLFDDASRIYHDQPLPPRAEFKLFVDHCLAIDEAPAKSFWSSRFDGQPAIFPVVRSEHRPDATSRLKRRFDFTSPEEVPLGLLSSYVEAAWAMTVLSYTKAESVAFGRVLSGRHPGLGSLGSTLGPAIVTMPVQVTFQSASTIQSIIKGITRERRAALTSPALQYGLKGIRSVSEAAKIASGFTTILNFRTPTDTGIDYVSPDLELHGEYEPHVPYALGIIIVLDKTGMFIETLFDESVVCERQTRRIIGQFEHILRLLLHSPVTTRIDEVPLLNDNDRSEILEWNRSTCLIESPLRCLHDLISDQALVQPTTMALEGPGGSLTYKQLDQMSDAVAAELQYLGLGREEVVGLIFEKSIWALVAQLAVLKAGAVCLPIDPEYPLARKKLMMDRAGGALVLTSTSIDVESLVDLASRILVVGDQLVSAGKRRNPFKKSQSSPSQAAYVFFTSGSTGTPKGHILEHGNLICSLKGIVDHLGWAPGVRMLQFANYVWDASVVEMLGPLLFGGCVCVPSEEERESGLAEFIDRRGVACAFLTPTMIRILSPETTPGLKTLISGGETMDMDAAMAWSSRLRFFNAWGTSETAGINAMSPHPLTPASPYPESIGRPISSALWIVDQDNTDKLVPVGAVGELVLEGSVVARGYLNDVANTAAFLTTRPTWAPTRQVDFRMYRTGDLARYNPDGSISLVGRRDYQVKINGQRFELGEVERILSSCKAVRHVMTTIIKTRHPSHQHLLVAVLSLQDPCFPRTTALKELPTELAPVAEERLRGIQDTVASILPRHMVPTVWHTVEDLPRTASQKIDRNGINKWLEERESSGSISSSPTVSKVGNGDVLVPPASDEERILQETWSELLSTPKSDIGRESSFIGLGGDSVLALHTATRCRNRGLRVSVATLLRSHSLASVAAASERLPDRDNLCQQVANGTPHILDKRTPLESTNHSTDTQLMTFLTENGFEKESIESAIEATDAQADMAALSELDGKGLYITMTLECADGLEVKRVTDACQAVIKHHPLLRTVFIQQKAVLLQVVLRHSPKNTILITAEESDGEQGDTEGHGLEGPFGNGVTTRFRLSTRGGKCRRISLSIRHALYDAVSTGIILQDLQAAYGGRQLSHGPSFHQWISYIKSLDMTASRQFWRKLLQGTSMTYVAEPTGLPLARMPSRDGICMRVPMKALKTSLGTPSSVFQAAWALVLSRVTGQREVVFGAIGANRNADFSSDIHRVPGPCINHLPVVARLDSKGMTVGSLIQQLHSQAVEAIPYQHHSFRDVISSCTDWPSWTRFGSMVIYQNYGSLAALDAVDLGDVKCPWSWCGGFGQSADVCIECKPESTELSIQMGYSRYTLGEEKASRIAQLLRTTLESIQDMLHQPICRISEANGTRNGSPGAISKLALASQAWEEVGLETTHGPGQKEAERSMFSCGGDLVTVLLLSRYYQRMGYSLSMQSIIDHPTQQGQARLLESL